MTGLLANPVSDFEYHPSKGASASAVASLLGNGISGALAERMLASPHVHRWLDAALAERLGPCPLPLTSSQNGIAGLDTTGLTRLALRAGAVWHASRIAKTHDGPTVRELVQHIGAEFRELALKDLATFPNMHDRSATSELSAPDLPIAIARDGTACLLAWCESQPRPIGWRILLRLRVNVRPDSRHREVGPQIVERLAGALSAT